MVTFTNVFLIISVVLLVAYFGFGYGPDWISWKITGTKYGPELTDPSLFEEGYPGSTLDWAKRDKYNYKIDLKENYGSAANKALSKMNEPYAFYSEAEKYGANNAALQKVLEKYDSYGGINNAALASVLSKDFYEYHDEKEAFKNNNIALNKTLLTDLPPF